MVERTGRIVANDTRETVTLDHATFLDTFTDHFWDELGVLIYVPLSSYEEDLILLAKLDTVMGFFRQAIDTQRFTRRTTAVLENAIDLITRAQQRGAEVWMIL